MTSEEYHRKRAKIRHNQNLTTQEKRRKLGMLDVTYNRQRRREKERESVRSQLKDYRFVD